MAQIFTDVARKKSSKLICEVSLFAQPNLNFRLHVFRRKCWCYKHVIFRQYCLKDKAYVLNHEIILGVLFPRLITNPVWWDWSWKARFIKDKNNSAAGYVSSSLTVCATPFFVHKIIVTEKIAVTFLFVYKIKMIGMLLITCKHCALSSPKK